MDKNSCRLLKLSPNILRVYVNPFSVRILFLADNIIKGFT